MKIDILLGLQWGDEGKGKIVDAISPDYDIIARFQEDRTPDIHSKSTKENMYCT